MEKRVDNLKKIVGDTLVNICLWNNLQRTDNRLDALYMTFYDVKKLKLKYKRECFGYVNSVDYEPKFDFNQYLKKLMYCNYTSTTSYGYYNKKNKWLKVK